MLHFVMGDREKWVFLLAIGILALNWPILSIFDTVLPAYLFGTWAALILMAWLTGRRKGSGGPGDHGGGKG